jgi:phosphoribosylglycinamide formyltransferase 1
MYTNATDHPSASSALIEPRASFLMQNYPLNLVILVSGSGTTLQNLLDVIAAENLDARIRYVIGSRPGIGAVQRAFNAGIPSWVVERSRHESLASFSREIFSLIDKAWADLVCLGGWLSLLDLPAAYAGRVMNIHPALLPSFGGKGMYGRRVHQAVLDHGCKVSGCTVHFVDAHYDSGPVILQRTCPVAEDDSAETLARRVFEEEKIAYPQAIRLFQAGKLKIEGRKVRIKL